MKTKNPIKIIDELMLQRLKDNEELSTKYDKVLDYTNPLIVDKKIKDVMIEKRLASAELANNKDVDKADHIG